MTEDGPRRYQWRGRDVSRRLFDWLEHFWPTGYDESAPAPDEWQLRTLERFIAARARGARIVAIGTSRRADGWLSRATQVLRDLERDAELDLEEALEESRRRRLELGGPPRVEGFDLATGPDRTIFGCSCGEAFGSIEGLADHVVRGHRWRPEEFEDHGDL